MTTDHKAENELKCPVIYAAPYGLSAASVAALMDELIAWWDQRPRSVVGMSGGTSHLKWVRDTFREAEVVERPKPVLTPEQMLLAAIFGEPCSGADDCPAPVHEHGCYADLDGTACNDPDDHLSRPGMASS